MPLPPTTVCLNKGCPYPACPVAGYCPVRCLLPRRRRTAQKVPAFDLDLPFPAHLSYPYGKDRTAPYPGRQLGPMWDTEIRGKKRSDSGKAEVDQGVFRVAS